MGIDHESPGTAGSGHARPTGDPLQMTEAEKRVAEWEARHDAAARGHRAGAETLQLRPPRPRTVPRRLLRRGD